VQATDVAIHESLVAVAGSVELDVVDGGTGRQLAAMEVKVLHPSVSSLKIIGGHSVQMVVHGSVEMDGVLVLVIVVLVELEVEVEVEVEVELEVEVVPQPEIVK